MNRRGPFCDHHWQPVHLIAWAANRSAADAYDGEALRCTHCGRLTQGRSAVERVTQAPLRPRCSAFRRHVRRGDDGEIITAVNCQWPVAHQGPHSFEQEDQ